ncbi:MULTISPECIES: DUF1572 family protein [Paenibacillus]
MEYSKDYDRSAEHYSYHTGQIVYASKLLQKEDDHLLNNWKHYF